MNEARTIAGRKRRRQTRWSVKLMDRLAQGFITVGGIGVIVAVLLVCLFLVSVVIPLFQSTTLGTPTQIATGLTNQAVEMRIDPYGEVAWTLQPDGTIQLIRFPSGEVLDEKPLVATNDSDAAADLTAWSLATRNDEAAFGFSDGSVRLGNVGFSISYLDAKHAPEELQALKQGEVTTYQQGVATRISPIQFRLQKLKVDIKAPTPSGSDSAITQIDYVRRSSGPMYAALAADGHIYISAIRERENLFTGEVSLTPRNFSLPLTRTEHTPDDAPAFVRLTGLGDMIYTAWSNGQIQRYDIRSTDQPKLVEELDLVPEPEGTLNQLEFLIGRTTLIAGDSLGRVQSWFPIRVALGPESSSDGWQLTEIHRLSDHSSPVTSLAVSPRSRLFVAGYADGKVDVLHATSAQVLTQAHMASSQPVQLLTVSPKGDTIVAANDQQLETWELRAAHPESTWATLFRPVWYEGYESPSHVWQSSSSQDESEPKFGLWPLVFGTLKATLYSMLFGAPIALLAAIYTSEFMKPRHKARIKPMIEMMASLPSVVLGFLAGLVIAPLVEPYVPQVITIVYTLPIVVISSALLWQLLPPTLSIRWAGWRFLIVLTVALPLGLILGWQLAPLMERLLFAGDIKLWLDGQIGSAVGGWVLMFIPISALVSILLVGRVINPMIRSISQGWSRRRSAFADGLKFVAVVLFTIALAWVMALLLSSLRFDPRGTFLDTYVQRNAMIVGFIMGFAIIPIIYTIADDALSGVPEHLRSASLGAGATPWQTTVRIVIPTAMSGLFSAIMIGLGRAVGETMIVLMAAGNTSILEWNIFNGFQTLSAAIATELPEAPPGDTHYRILFLAAFTLFVMTFFLNTIAEIVRERFRRRAYLL